MARDLPPPELEEDEGEGLERADSPDTGAADPAASSEPGAAGGASAIYRAMKVRLEGVRRTREARVSGDGSFRVETLPHGDYRLEVSLGQRLLASFPVSVIRRETSRVKLVVLGYDLADLDRDEARDDLAVRVETQVGKLMGGATRVVLPDGSVRARLAHGGREYLLPGGLVRREEPGRRPTSLWGRRPCRPAGGRATWSRRRPRRWCRRTSSSGR